MINVNSLSSSAKEIILHLMAESKKMFSQPPKLDEIWKPIAAFQNGNGIMIYRLALCDVVIPSHDFRRDCATLISEKLIIAVKNGGGYELTEAGKELLQKTPLPNELLPLM